MANIKFNFQDQIRELATQVANLSVENSQLKAINKAAFRRIEELENPKKETGKVKPKASAK